MSAARHTLDIVGLGFKGDGLAEDAHGQRWRVAGALDGERVEVRIAEVARGRRVAVLERVLRASPARREAGCEFAAACPGCQLRVMSQEARLRDRRAAWRAALERMVDVDPTRVRPARPATHEDGYRWSAKARWLPGGALGMWPRRGVDADPISLARCVAQTPKSREVLRWIEAALRRHRVAVLDREAPEPGAVAEVWLDVGVDSGRVTLVTASGVNDALQLAAQDVSSRAPQFSIWHGRMSLRDPGGPLQDVAPLIEGPPLRVQRGGRLLETSWGAWTSATPILADAALEATLEGVRALRGDGIETLVEVGCGVGAHTIELAGLAQKVIGVDLSRAAIEDARRNLARYAPEHDVVLRVGRADKALRRLLASGVRAEVLVLHGMRQPMGERACRAASPLGARGVVLVSPSVFAMAEDLRCLREVGFEVEWIQPLDTMPQTYHLMAVALMSRRHDARHVPSTQT